MTEASAIRGNVHCLILFLPVLCARIPLLPRKLNSVPELGRVHVLLITIVELDMEELRVRIARFVIELWRVVPGHVSEEEAAVTK